MQDMTPTSTNASSSKEQCTAKLAMMRKDGRPHVAPVLLDLDGEDFVFTAWYATVKAANIPERPSW